jgi:hypothetical protein
MKIIHSYWSKPTFAKSSSKYEDRKNGGWTEKKYNYMSWALSCLKFKKYYGYIELITDQVGNELLIDKLKLPYDNVEIKLDTLNDFPHDLWAVSKLLCYTLQDDPFMHVDGDVYIWDKMESIANKPLVAQNEDYDLIYYYDVWKDLLNNFDYIPNFMIDDIKNQKVIRAANAGVFGGTDVAFIKDFAYEALDFLEQNKQAFNKVNLGSSVLIYEQYLFSSLARKYRKEVTYLFPNMDRAYAQITNFIKSPRKVKYVHAVGNAKENKNIGAMMANCLMVEFPEYYYYIQELIESFQI